MSVVPISPVYVNFTLHMLSLSVYIYGTWLAKKTRNIRVSTKFWEYSSYDVL